MISVQSKIRNAAMVASAMLLFVGSSTAQSYTETARDVAYQEDFEAWTSIGTSFKLAKKLKGLAEQGFRFTDNASTLSTTYTDLGVRYKINDYVKVVGVYRFNIKPSELRHRIQADLGLKSPRIERFVFSYRFRWQTLFAVNDDPKTYFRNKLAVKYDIKGNPVTPFFSSEFYYGLKNTGNTFDRLRLTFGGSLNLPGKTDLSVAYRFEKESNVTNPAKNHIFVIGYSFELFSKKKKKKDVPATD
jgi:hypothetical protein